MTLPANHTPHAPEVHLMLSNWDAKILRRHLREQAVSRHLVGAAKEVLDRTLKQLEDDLSRPCTICCREAGKSTDTELASFRRDILDTFTSNAADPTLTYRLACGHSVIDL